MLSQISKTHIFATQVMWLENLSFPKHIYKWQIQELPQAKYKYKWPQAKKELANI